MLALPIDQGLEHGPIDFFPNPEAADPHFQFRLAVEGGYNAIACQVGLAERYYPEYAGKVPLILKLNGRTNIPPSDEAFSPCHGSVEDAVRLGADAVGYTLYVGSPRQDEDFIQVGRIRQECERYGMPLVVWGYPRGKWVETKGGRDSLYAVDYAARVAREIGADIVKLNVPKRSDKDTDMPKPYDEMDLDYEEGARKVFASAVNTPVLVSGGSKISDEDLLEKARAVMRAGATGLIFGRNMWQRPMDEALEMTAKVKEILREYPS
ncbi:MAG: fructose-bisphosphate aldolase [Gemmatimonadetes bacterium]|nr:fructose-bisphosphate aldolase [Gemmatimonadota bacterium]NIT68797.1 fructose-bisphosphate aldolase [Gemmatimonadota bacterium]NIU53830.1 fructose-bisphosphate aldolase [Gemmatimonadota bacterium]NIW77520.1 fructose-bisphosphate aldolase [Gemmatimonadota bacterium]NIY37374.1 fructose-bisphosphate aldolase [Gemmatimonadota bacterium]